MALQEVSPALDTDIEHVDVLIIGAGLSGIGAACHLKRRCPGKSFAIVESRDGIGGTWDLFRYPGIRSDSDMFTLGYSFKPWKAAKALADGPSIRSYVREAATEHDLDSKIRFKSKVVRAEWCSESSRWTVEMERTDTGQRSRMSAGFLFGCTGYYRYDEGYTPNFEGVDRFQGQLVHPQHWPEDLDYTGKRVLIIGSGATAVTLLPAMSDRAEHVTMLQRSPSYVLSIPGSDPVALLLRKLLPVKTAYAVLRWKNVLLAMALFGLSQRRPNLMRRLLRKGAVSKLPEGYAVDTHFNPTYKPWDQRMCMVPDGDFFDAISTGHASVVTDRIETFTEKGVKLASGEELEADIVITATGLNLLVMGGISLSVDGEEVDVSKTVGYKGMMFSGVPNMALTLGYTNASWTLKADLVAEYVCRVLNHMDRNGFDRIVPLQPGPSVTTEPFLNLKSGYVERAIDELPKQGSVAPWRLNQNYVLDVQLMKRGPLEDEGIEFSAGAPSSDRRPANAVAA
jgi:monooxygenase